MQTAGETPALRSHKQRQRRPPEGGRYKFNRNDWRSKDRRYKTKTNGCPVPKTGPAATNSTATAGGPTLRDRRYKFKTVRLTSNAGRGGCFACFVPLEDRVADALHGFARDLLGLLGAGVENIPNFGRIGFIFSAICLDRLDPFDQAFGHFFFAVHAADSGGTAVAVNAGYRVGWGE